MKGFALGLALKQRRKATRKSPIVGWVWNPWREKRGTGKWRSCRILWHVVQDGLESKREAKTGVAVFVCLFVFVNIFQNTLLACSPLQTTQTKDMEYQVTSKSQRIFEDWLLGPYDYWCDSLQMIKSGRTGPTCMAKEKLLSNKLWSPVLRLSWMNSAFAIDAWICVFLRLPWRFFAAISSVILPRFPPL